MNNQRIARELVRLARDLTAERWNDRMLKKGLVIVLPNGFEVVVGKRIVDEFGPAVEVTDERGKKYVKGIDNFLTWLRATRAKPKVIGAMAVARDLIAVDASDIGDVLGSDFKFVPRMSDRNKMVFELVRGRTNTDLLLRSVQRSMAVAGIKYKGISAKHDGKDVGLRSDLYVIVEPRM